MELQGKVHQILETETKGEKNFKTKKSLSIGVQNTKECAERITQRYNFRLQM